MLQWRHCIRLCRLAFESCSMGGVDTGQWVLTLGVEVVQVTESTAGHSSAFQWHSL